jgi:hypothetical protein
VKFKFVLYEQETDTTLWSHDGTSVNGSEPSGNVILDVVDGLFTHDLGQPPEPYVTSNLLFGARDPVVRVWVQLDGNFVQFPDQPIAGAPYALNSESAERSYQRFTAEGLIHAKSEGFKFPDGTIQSTAATGGGGTGGNTLDQAYDQGGSGAGRTITADAGPVVINGPGGLTVQDDVNIGTSSSGAQLDIRNHGGTALLVRGRLSTLLPTGFVHANIEETGHMWLGNPLDQANSAGKLDLYGGAFTPAITLDAVTGGIAATSFEGERVACDTLQAISTSSIHSKSNLYMDNSSGQSVAYLGTNGLLRLGLENSAANGTIYLYGSQSYPRVEIFGSSASINLDSTTNTAISMSGGTRSFKMFDSMGDTAINIDGQYGRVTARIVTSDRLELTGGADLAEPFTMSGGRTLPEGTVVVIDETSPGNLRESGSAYDRRVAGVVSGAGGIRAGITLAQDGVFDEGQNVALTGRVYVRADVSNGPIRPGDRLTTSARPGHAMKATDPARSDGAVLGKAMTSLESGTGLVLVLVNLQ